MADPNTIASAQFGDTPADPRPLDAATLTTDPPASNSLGSAEHSNDEAIPIAMDGMKPPPENAVMDVNGHYLLVTS